MDHLSEPADDAGGAAADVSASNNVLMWCLIVGGIFLVLFADAIGNGLVPKGRSGNGFVWDPQMARYIAQRVQVIGAMAFAAGLVERLIIGFRSAIQIH